MKKILLITLTLSYLNAPLAQACGEKWEHKETINKIVTFKK